MSEFPPISDLVPHTPPMLVLEALTAWKPGYAECMLTVTEGDPFVQGGHVSALVGIEYMGQAIAACLGHEAFLGGEGVRVGMIIGCRRMTIHRDSFHVGEALTVHARRVRGSELISRFSCEVRSDAAVAVTAELTVYHADKPPDASTNGSPDARELRFEPQTGVADAGRV